MHICPTQLYYHAHKNTRERALAVAEEVPGAKCEVGGAAATIQNAHATQGAVIKFLKRRLVVHCARCCTLLLLLLKPLYQPRVPQQL